MKRSKVLLVSMLAVAVIAAAALPAAARRGGAMGSAMGGGRGMGMGPMFTSEQQEQIEKIHERYQDQRVELTNRLQALHVEMGDLMQAEGEPDFGAIEKKLEDISSVRLELAKLRLRIHKEIRPLLTDDQKTLFDAGMGRMLMHSRGMRGGRGMSCPMGMNQGCAPGMGNRMGMGQGAMGGQRGAWGGRQGMMGYGMPGCIAPVEPPDDGDDD
jgi:Spy/CpxP family protein refolding chaperone